MLPFLLIVQLINIAIIDSLLASLHRLLLKDQYAYVFSPHFDSFCLLLSLGTPCPAQYRMANGAINWENSYGGFSYDIAGTIRQTTDGGYIVTGCTGPAGDKRFLTMKLYPDGELDWQKVYGGTEDDRSFSVKQTPDDGYIIAGRTASDNGDVTGQHGDYDFWVVKLGPCGVNPGVEMEDKSLQSLEAAASSSYFPLETPGSPGYSSPSNWY
jgi:hypothetical protein